MVSKVQVMDALRAAGRQDLCRWAGENLRERKGGTVVYLANAAAIWLGAAPPLPREGDDNAS